MSDFLLLLSEKDRSALMDVAQRSALDGLKGLVPFQPITSSYPLTLQRLQSSFVRLHCGSAVVSCAGTIEPSVPLVNDVCHNAYEAASRLSTGEATDLEIEVMLVGQLRCLSARSWEQVLDCLEPSVHGVLLQHDQSYATFTPDKWQTWPDKSDFMQQLQRCAGMEPGRWSSSTHVSTYQVKSLGRVAFEVPGDARLLSRNA